jgi:hypothetical protein
MLCLVCKDTNKHCMYLEKKYHMCSDPVVAPDIGCRATCGVCRTYFKEYRIGCNTIINILYGCSSAIHMYD